MEEIIGIVQDAVDYLVPYIKAEAIIAMAMLGLAFLVGIVLAIVCAVKHYRKGRKK